MPILPADPAPENPHTSTEAESVIILPPEANPRNQWLDRTSEFILRHGLEPALGILFDFRSARDHDTIAQNGGTLLSHRQGLEENLRALYIHGITTAVTLLDRESYAHWLRTAKPLVETPIDCAEALVEAKSPDVVLTTGYPVPACAVGRDADGTLWAVHLREPFVVASVAFSSLLDLSGNRRAVVTAAQMDYAPLPEADREAVLARLYRAVCEHVPAEAANASEAPLLSAETRPGLPRHLLVQNTQGDVAYAAVVCGPCIAQVRLDAPEFCGLHWAVASLPAEEDRARHVSEMRAFLHEDAANGGFDALTATAAAPSAIIGGAR